MVFKIALKMLSKQPLKLLILIKKVVRNHIFLKFIRRHHHFGGRNLVIRALVKALILGRKLRTHGVMSRYHRLNLVAKVIAAHLFLEKNPEYKKPVHQKLNNIREDVDHFLQRTRSKGKDMQGYIDKWIAEHREQWDKRREDFQDRLEDFHKDFDKWLNNRRDDDDDRNNRPGIKWPEHNYPWEEEEHYPNPPPMDYGSGNEYSDYGSSNNYDSHDYGYGMKQ